MSLLLAFSVSLPTNARVVEVKKIPELVKTLEIQNPSVVLFSADWCPACKIFHPIYEKLSDQMSMNFLVVDVDNPDMFPLASGIPAIPTVLVLSLRKDAEGTHILACDVDAPNTLENVKKSILKCIVNMK